MRVVSSMWVRLLVIVGLAVLLEPQASALSLEDVEKMIKGGVEDITIIQTIQSSGESFTDAEIERYQEAMKSTTPPFSIDVWNAILAKRGSRSGVDTQPQCTVSVQLSERPPSRVWCYFTTAGVGIQQQHVVEFDTAASNSTLRRVNLRRGEDYLFSCSSEPLFKKRILNTHSSPEDVDISWKFHGRNSQVAGYLSSLGWADDVLNDSDSYDEDDVEYAREVMGLSAGSSLVDSDGESTFSRTNRENELSNQLLAGIGPVTKHLISIESDCSGEGVVSGLAPAIYSSLESKNLRLVEVNVKSAPLYSLDDAIANLSTNDISKGEVRSLGVPPALVSDTLDLLAEIALERAKENGLELLRKRFHEWCTSLTYAAVFENGYPGTPLLPKTCNVLKTVDFFAIAETLPELGSAIKSDLMDVAYTWIEISLEKSHGESWTKVFRIVVRSTREVASTLARESRLPSSEEVQLVLINLAKQDWSTIEGVDSQSSACMSLVFATAALCIERAGACDVQLLSDVLANPSVYFSGIGGVESCYQDQPELGELVTRLVDVFNPPASSPVRAHVRHAVELIFDIGEYALRRGGSQWSCRGSGDERSCEDITQSQTAIRHLRLVRTLVLAFMDEDYVTAVSVIADEVMQSKILCGDEDHENTEVCRAARRMMPVVSVLAANARSLKEATANPERADELREARKAALEHLIDASTDRESRDGEFVISLGSPVGFSVFGSFGDPRVNSDSDDDNDIDVGGEAHVALSLPMGIAFQYLPGESTSYMGFHSQLSIVDLGEFLDSNDDDLLWEEFLIVGGQLGWALGTPDNVFIVGIDIRVTPIGERSGLGRVSAFVSYYVPFFDFN